MALRSSISLDTRILDLPPNIARLGSEGARKLALGLAELSRLTGVSRDAISRHLAKAGGQAKALHDELVAFSPADP